MAKQIVCDCHVVDTKPAPPPEPVKELGTFGKIVVAVLTVGAVLIGGAIAASNNK